MGEKRKNMGKKKKALLTIKMSGGNEPRSRFHSFCTRLMNLPALRGVSVREAEKRKKTEITASARGS
jgi:hypothetical protein